MGVIADESLVILRAGLAASATDEEKAVVAVATRAAEDEVIRHLRYNPIQQVRTEFYPAMTTPTQGAGVWEATNETAYIRRTSTASTSELQLRHLPVRYSDANGANTIDLRIDYDGRFGAKSGAFAAATQQTEGTDFWPSYDGQDDNSISLCRDGILRSIGLWPDEPGSIKVTYVSGYTYTELSGESDLVNANGIQAAVVEEAARRVQQAFSMQKHTNVGWLSGAIVAEKLGDYSYRLDSGVTMRLFSGIYGIMPENKERLSGFANMMWV